MAFPLICPDSNMKLYFLPKNNNPSMLDEGAVAVYSRSEYSGKLVHDKKSKFPEFLTRPSAFHHRPKLFSFDSFLVGGFLGSKSQGRSGNTCQMIGDFLGSDVLSNLFGAASECLAKHRDLRSAPSPPKKKFALEERLSNETAVDTLEFPCVIEDQEDQGDIAEGSKQSYAEVAKATSSKPVKPSRSKDSNDSSCKQETSYRRRPKSGGHRSGRRKVNKRDCRGQAPPIATDISTQSSPSPCSESWKDLRLNQQEKYFSQLKLVNNRNPLRFDRHSNSCPSRQDPFKERKSERGLRTKRRSNFRENKRGSQTQIIDCDIDKINWRTGEPISCKMVIEHVEDLCERDVVLDQPPTICLSNDENKSDNMEEQKQQEPSSSDNVSWTDPLDFSSKASSSLRRRSLSSECSVDSEDSFVIFQSGALSDSMSDLASDWSDCDSDGTFESDTETSEEDDLCDILSPASLRLKEVNELWQREYADLTPVDAKNNEPDKMVRFSSSHPVVHRMHTWDFAYRSSRIGPWEVMARDRERFRTRIRQFESIISPILAHEHRNKIWNELSSHQNF